MAAVEQPHFMQRTSTPSFSSPLDHLDARPSSSSPPPPPPLLLPPQSAPADVSMSSSTATAGQRHDREDADMDDARLTNGLPQASVEAPREATSNREHGSAAIAVQVAALDDNAMDTTPDTEVELVLPDAPAGEQDQDATAMTPPPPAPNAHVQIEPTGHAPDAPAAISEDTTPPSAILPPINPDLPVDPSAQPPPPPPPPPIEPVHSDDESSDDDDDGLPSWHPISEDTSSPDEDELKEIDESTEHSALDHEYWESKAFLPLEEPEYTAGETGRIQWNIDAYNGTREKPNRDLVMKSDVATIGGHKWQIKFYPKGNDSDYLSVYLECLSVMKPKKEENTEERQDQDGSKETVEEETRSDDAKVVVEGAPEDASAAPLIPIDAQHAPLPLLGSKQMPKRKCVAAQVSVVLYNPTEPRVHYSKTALHRFCSGSPDWGWTRFHGPYYDIAHRMRGQREALLRHDKLAFTAYVRIVEDETNCLWEHANRENPWDSFAMTGLQGLMLGEDASAPGGNMISAIASWMLFKPFRTLLYNVKASDVYHEPLLRPKPLINALQKVLYLLRTQVEPGAGAIALDDVLDALDWYGIHERLDKLDVIETWEVLRLKLEEELADTEHAAALQAICGPKRDYSVNEPSYRVPVVGVDSMQQAIEKSPNFTVPGQALPQLLTIEMERQNFDLKTRSYVKVLNKVTLDDHVKVSGTDYTLYGFVVHKQTLQSYVYQPILRPEGPGSRWYSYSDSKDENQVKCLTKRQAVDVHEGKPGAEQIVGNDAVAYVAMYVRNDVAQTAFTVDAQSEEWTVPKWIMAEIEKGKPPKSPSPMPRVPSDEPSATAAQDANTATNTELPEALYFKVYDSRLFAEHEGPGVFDVYHAKYQEDSAFVKTVALSPKDGCKDVREKLTAAFEGIRDPRQLKFWFLDPIRGALCRPNMLGTGKIEYSSGTYRRYSYTKEWDLGDAPYTSRIWVHVIDYEKLPELPKEVEKDDSEKGPEMTEDLQTLPVAEPSQAEVANAANGALPWDAIPPPEEVLPLSEDTPMSEPDEPTLQQATLPEGEPVVAPAITATEEQDTAMVENEFGPADASPTVDPLDRGRDPVSVGDTEMGGTQDEMPPPPPPPPVDIPAGLMQPPPPVRVPSPEPPPDEIYFFLKFWNPETQTLEPRGSHIALKSDKVDETVANLLSVPAESQKKILMWEEEEISTTRSIKPRRSFSQTDLHNLSIIIVGLPLTQSQRDELASRAAFAEPASYLSYRAFARNFPHKLNGHFTYNYFSSESYKGEIKSGHHHGHGTLIYHSGATYTGTFRLGLRHGHGLHTFQNGDTYDGSWAADAQHGTGTYVEAATGNTYVGGWQANKKFGEGVTHWKNAQEAERLCRICWEEDAAAAFYDCGHVVACLTCAREVQACPVCRKRVVTVLRLFYVA